MVIVRRLAVWAALSLAVTACTQPVTTDDAPEATPAATEGGASDEVGEADEQDAGEEAGSDTDAAGGTKTLTIGMSQEPLGFGPTVTQIASGQVEQTVHAGLTYRAADQSLQPWLAEKIPSLDDGDWVANDDGTMEVTWQLREDITWHDGTPLAVEDVIFGWEVLTNPELATFGSAEAEVIDRIEKVDDRTFTAHYSEPYVHADGGIPRLLISALPLPEHILRDDYENQDSEQFLNHPYWTTEFVGVGPYKLTEFAPGSHISLEAYDDYFLGPPNIDEVVWRWFDDTNSLVAAILAGEIDVSVDPNIDLEQAQVVEQQWDDGEVRVIPGYGWDWIAFNTNEDPRFEDIRVRQALLYALNREEMVEAMFGGLNPVADSFMSPVHPLMTDEVAESMNTYSYDPDRALELLGEAGYTQDDNGTLVDGDGNPLDISIRTIAGDSVKEAAQAIVSSQWSEIGVTVSSDNLASESIYDSSHLFQFGWPSAFLFNFGGGPDLLAGDYRCEDIPTEDNNWSGANLGNYCSEEYDEAFNARPIAEALEVEERVDILTELMPIWTRDLPLLPLYFKSTVVTVRDGVTGVDPSGTNEGWTAEIHQWDLTG